jgi:hypothetical protein
LPIFDDLLDVLIDSKERWAQTEARFLARERRRMLDFVTRAMGDEGALAPTPATPALLRRVGRWLRELRAFAELAVRLQQAGEDVLVSFSP